MTRRRRRAAPRTAPPRTAPPAPAAEGGTFERARAAGALTPADHRRAEAVGGATRITIQGVALDVDPAAVFDDYEVVEALTLLNDGRGTPADVVHGVPHVKVPAKLLRCLTWNCPRDRGRPGRLS